jgi:hypothetical protein
VKYQWHQWRINIGVMVASAENISENIVAAGSVNQ